jgi:hypothetical protein
MRDGHVTKYRRINDIMRMDGTNYCCMNIPNVCNMEGIS